MSLDVFVACAAAVSLPSHLPDRVDWKRHDTGSFTAENGNVDWIVEVWLIDAPKDLKEFKLSAERKLVVGLSLQGNDDAGFKLLEEAVDTIAKNCDGILLDI